MTSREPRVCIASLRGINNQAAWCSNYEFEDVISDIDDADIFTLAPGIGYEPRRWVVRRMAWRSGLCEIARRVNPGLRPIRLERDYDLFAFICMNPGDLIYLNAIDGWKTKAKKKICFMVEFYAGWIKEYDFHLSLLQNFDHIALCFGGSVDAVQSHLNRPCHHVPLGADVLRFSPYPNPVPRCIDIYSMGRRIENAHETFLDLASKKQIFYLHDTIPGLLVQPRNHKQHRDLIANCAKRSNFFITYPAKVDIADETRGQSEVGARFYEGAASGAVMLGQAPSIPTFKEEFNWKDAVIDLGTSRDDIQNILSRSKSDPDYFEQLRRRNAREALERFDWSYRWSALLNIVGMSETTQHQKRSSYLNALAKITQN